MMVPTTLNMLVLSDALSGFLREHEHITMELALVDRSVNPAEEGFRSRHQRPCGQQLRRCDRRSAVSV